MGRARSRSGNPPDRHDFVGNPTAWQDNRPPDGHSKFNQIDSKDGGGDVTQAVPSTFSSETPK